MFGKLTTAVAVLVLAAPAFAQTLQVSGSREIEQRIAGPNAASIHEGSAVTLKVNVVGNDRAIIALLDGSVSAAAISGSLQEAVADARIAAFAEGRLLSIPATLAFHEVARDGSDALGFVTLGAPGADLVKVLSYLRSEEGRKQVKLGL